MEILIARSATDIETAYDNLFGSNIIGCDTETSGLSAANSTLFSVQFSDGDFHCLVPSSEGIGLGKLAEILTDGSITKIFHNARFDLSFLTENGYPVANVFDTMIAEKVLTKGANQSVSLAETLYRYFAIDLDKSQRKKFGRSWDRVWTDELVDYAMNDVAYLPELMDRQVKWMQDLGLTETYLEKMRAIG